MESWDLSLPGSFREDQGPCRCSCRCLWSASLMDCMLQPPPFNQRDHHPTLTRPTHSIAVLIIIHLNWSHVEKIDTDKKSHQINNLATVNLILNQHHSKYRIYLYGSHMYTHKQKSPCQLWLTLSRSTF